MEIGNRLTLDMRVSIEVGFEVVCILLFVLHCSGSRIAYQIMDIAIVASLISYNRIYRIYMLTSYFFEGYTNYLLLVYTASALVNA